jgi:hypothetical protein
VHLRPINVASTGFTPDFEIGFTHINHFFNVFIYSIEEFHIPARRIVIPDPHFSMVDETFDSNQRVITWKWGNMNER